MSHHGPNPVHQLQLDAQAEGNRQHDVGKEHRSVDPEAPHWLEGDLRAELGVLADGEEVVRLADLPVFGERPARLSHEPDGPAIDQLPARRPNQGWQQVIGRRPADFARLDRPHPPAIRLTRC